MHIHNRKYLKKARKELRNNLTSAEATLWISLQGRKLKGRKFRRQHSIANYIVDFYCPAEKLVVELDGEDHFHSPVLERDRVRDKYLASLNIKVLRFENEEVFDNPEHVLECIALEFTTPDPS
ncbi:MAG: endonuclease domain-containing protein [Cyclobacteriaceae bacterium]